MPGIYSFEKDDPFVKPVLIPGDYLPEVQRKLVVGFRAAGATESNLFICANGWAVNTEDPRNESVIPVWKSMANIPMEEPDYAGCMAVPLRAPITRKVASIVFFGNGEEHTPGEIEAVRLAVVERVNPIAELEGFQF